MQDNQQPQPEPKQPLGQLGPEPIPKQPPIPEQPWRPSPRLQPQPQPPSEKKELLRREEVRTMQKDLARLQEEEALKERERLSKIKTEEELKKERERIERLKKEEEEKMFAKSALLEQERAKLQAERLEKQAMAEKPTPTPPPKKKEWPKPAYKLPFALPKRPSVLEKFWARALVIVILLVFWGVFITFWYWFLVVRGREAPPLQPPAATCTDECSPSGIRECSDVVQYRSCDNYDNDSCLEWSEPSACPPGQTCSEGNCISAPEKPPAPPVSAALITTETQNIVEFTADEELPTLFQEAIKRFGEENTFSRIIFYNTAQNKYLGLHEFLSAFQVNVPSDVSAYLPEDFTAFVYSSKIANRFGFIAKITEYDALNQGMLAWEATMEQDVENLFALLGKREPAKDNKFRKATYRGATFRYLSFPAINFGVVWAILPVENQEAGQTEYYFVFTSSGESMMRVIDRLTI